MCCYYDIYTHTCVFKALIYLFKIMGLNMNRQDYGSLGSSLFSVGYIIDFSGISLAPSGKVQRTFTTADTEAQRDFDIIRIYFIFFSMSLCLCGEVVNPY